MARLRGCVTCFIDVERIAMADGTFVVFCATCDMIGHEHEILIGGPVWAAGMGERRVAGAGKRRGHPRPVARVKTLVARAR